MTQAQGSRQFPGERCFHRVITLEPEADIVDHPSQPVVEELDFASVTLELSCMYLRMFRSTIRRVDNAGWPMAENNGENVSLNHFQSITLPDARIHNVD